MSFGRSSQYCLGSEAPKQEKHGTVRNIKGSPEKGKKRLLVREKSTGGRTFSVDVDIRSANKVERKKDYTFRVEEKNGDDRYGSMGRKKKSGHRIYSCEGAPSEYAGHGTLGSGFKSFDGGNRMKSSSGSSGRTRF